MKHRLWIALGLVSCVLAGLVAWRLHPVERPRAQRPVVLTSSKPSRVARSRRANASRPRPAPPVTRAASALSPTNAPSAPAKIVPTSAGTPTRTEQLATTVLAAAVHGDWMVVDEHDTPCPPQRIRIVYEPPTELASYVKGAYFEPLGPAPDDGRDEINGLLLCEGSTFLYRGFEAYYRADRGQWDVYPFPVIE